MPCLVTLASAKEQVTLTTHCRRHLFQLSSDSAINQEIDHLELEHLELDRLATHLVLNRTISVTSCLCMCAHTVFVLILRKFSNKVSNRRPARIN